jgi:NADH-quinone oxidoreductase subunit J
MINNLSNFLQANLIFYLLYFTLLLSSSLVFLGKNVKFSAIFLMLSFLFASFLLLLSGSEFIGLLLIVVYVGAISILFLFAIMLTESKATDSKKNSLTFAAPTGVLFCIVFYISVWLSLPVASYTNCHYSDITNSLILVNKFIMAGSETNGFGNLLYSYYALHILILGILLLAILLGVFRLTNSLTSFSKIQFTSKQLARSPANFMRTYKPLSFYITKLDFMMGNFELIEEEGESMLSNYLPDIKNEINFKNYTYESYKNFFMRTSPLIFSSSTPMPTRMPVPTPDPWLEIDLRPIPKCPCPYKPSGFGCPCPLLSDHTPCPFKSTYIPNPESRCRLPNDDSPKLPDFIIFPPQIEKKEDVFILAKQVKSKVPQIEVSKQQKKNKGSNTVRVVHRAFSTGSSSSLHDSSIESFSEPVSYTHLTLPTT